MSLTHLLRLGALAGKQVLRHRLRTLLTVAGVAAGMALFTAVETLQDSLRRATEMGAEDTTLVVYRENRFCPSTSRLPEHYLAEIRSLEGVREAIPVQVVVNNCGASLDVVTFRGVPATGLKSYNPDLEIIGGSFEAWLERTDGALVGKDFAVRRGLSPGDLFAAAGITVYVAGVVKSPLPQDESVAYVHLEFLQQASRVGLGTVTQFNVRAGKGTDLEVLAEEIDALFAADQAPTITRPEKAFFAQTARDMIEMVNFTRWLGLAAVIAVVALVANALLLIARGRVKENAILKTLGYPAPSIGLLLMWEGVILGGAGGLAGTLLAAGFFHFQRLSFGNEGLVMALTPSPGTVLGALLTALLLGIAASIAPAVSVARKPLVNSLRKGT